jgi:hypothetical protein
MGDRRRRGIGGSRAMFVEDVIAGTAMFTASVIAAPGLPLTCRGRQSFISLPRSPGEAGRAFMGICLVGVVGQRPSAIAVVIKTLFDVGRTVDRVMLLYRSRTEREAQVICDWCAESPRVVPCERQRLADDVCTEQAGTGTAALSALGPEPGEVVCFGDPGLSVDVALLSLAFPGATFAHADLDELHLIRHGAERSHERIPLSDLGFDALMKLYALKPVDFPRARKLDVPADALPEIRAGISFDGRYGFAFAYERRGHLHLLAHIHQGKAIDRLSAVRGALEHINKKEMNRLRPVLAGCCMDPGPMKQFCLANVAAFGEGSAEFRRWMLGDPPRPGAASYFPDARVRPVGLVGRKNLRPGALKKTLLVAAGRNPVPTLTSLSSHRPTNAWIVYDATTPAVIEFVQGIRSAALGGFLHEELMSLKFIASDVLGSGIDSLKAAIPDDGVGFEADLSPGSKAQAAALARLPVARRWTFKGDVYVDLRDGVQRPAAPAGLRTILAAARAYSDGFAPDAKTQEFLRAFSRALAACDTKPGPRFALDAEGAEGVEPSKSVRHSDWRITRTALGSGRFDWIVESSGMSRSSPSPLSGGELLEQCVAQLMLDASASEVVTNVRFGQTADAHVSEFDVAATFDGTCVGVSVKGGRDGTVVDGRSQASVQVTRALGRLAIPVLVRRRVQANLAEASREGPLGTLLVDFGDLLDGANVGRLIRETAKARRTTVVDPE